MMANQSLQVARGLAALCSQLNDAQISRDKLNSLMGTLGRLADARGVLLVKKRYFTYTEFLFETVAGWMPDGGESELLQKNFQVADLNAAWWPSLQERKPVVWGHAFSPFKAARNLVMVPLFCNGRIYGMLCFTDFRSDPVPEESLECALAAGQIFELWLSKSQAERLFVELIEFIPNPIMILDTNGGVTAWNRSAEMMSGSSDRAKEKPGAAPPLAGGMPARPPEPSNLIFEPNPGIESRYLELQRQGDTLSALARCDQGPGNGTFVASKTGVLHDATGRPSSSIHFIEDVTREREMAKNLRRSEAMYRTMIDYAGVGIVLFRKDTIIYHNEHFATLLGIMDRNITYRDFLNWIDPQEKEIVDFFKHSHDALQEPARFEFRARNGDGAARFYRGYARVIGYEDQAAIHFILDDITEQKELAEKAHLNELRMHHEDRLTALGVMAAGIAHELNQPLNTIRVLTDGFLFGREKGWELDLKELFEGLEMISRQVLRMSDVIQNIRDFAREDRGKCEMISPNEAIKNVLSMIGKQFEAHGIHIEVRLEPNLPPLESNVNNLEQVIMNLLVNARQALEEQRRSKKRLWIKTGYRYGQIFIEVGDNAAGIPEDLMLKVFDPFFTTKEAGKGTGLGLSISKTIVSDFHGVLKAYNNSDGGATFFITAPAGDKNEHPVNRR